MEAKLPWKSVTYVPEHLLPMSPVYTEGWGEGVNPSIGCAKTPSPCPSPPMGARGLVLVRFYSFSQHPRYITGYLIRVNPCERFTIEQDLPLLDSRSVFFRRFQSITPVPSCPGGKLNLPRQRKKSMPESTSGGLLFIRRTNLPQSGRCRHLLERNVPLRGRRSR